MGSGQRHDGDGDGRAVHVNGGAQGDGHGVQVLIQAQPLAQVQVHGDVGGGAAGEEGVHAAFTQAAEHQGVGVAVQQNGHDGGGHDQGHEQHAAHQQRQQTAVAGEDLQAVGGNVVEHQAQNAEGSQLDDPAHGGGDGVGHVLQHGLGGVAGQAAQGQAEHHGPGEDAHVVGAGQRGDGVSHHVVQQGAQNLGNAAGSGFHRGVGEGEGNGKQEAADNGHTGGQEGGEHIQNHHRAEAVADAHAGVGQRGDDQHEHQHGGHGLQCAHEDVTQNGQDGEVGSDGTQNGAQDQTNQNAKDQGDALPTFDDCVHFAIPFLLRRRRRRKMPPAALPFLPLVQRQKNGIFPHTRGEMYHLVYGVGHRLSTNVLLAITNGTKFRDGGTKVNAIP